VTPGSVYMRPFPHSPLLTVGVTVCSANCVLFYNHIQFDLNMHTGIEADLDRIDSRCFNRFWYFNFAAIDFF